LEAREERSSRAPVATVEGTWSSESRRPSRGGGGTKVSVGPASRTKASSFVLPMHRRQRVSRDRREGERRQRAEGESQQDTRTLHEDFKITRGLEDTSFARFTDPCIWSPAERREKWSGRYRGRETPSHRKKPAPGSIRSDGSRGSPLVIALARERHGGSEKEDGLRHRPCEETRAVAQCPYVGSSCRSRQAVSDLEYAPVERSKKSGDGGERGSSSRRSSKEGVASERVHARRTLSRNGSGPAEAQGDERSSSSGFERRLKRHSGSRNRDRKVTGFYEESLSMEGIPGFTSQWLSRVLGHGGLGGSFIIRNIQPKGWNRDEKRERRQGCQRHDRL